MADKAFRHYALGTLALDAPNADVEGRLILIEETTGTVYVPMKRYLSGDVEKLAEVLKNEMRKVRIEWVDSSRGFFVPLQWWKSVSWYPPHIEIFASIQETVNKGWILPVD